MDTEIVSVAIRLRILKKIVGQRTGICHLTIDMELKHRVYVSGEGIAELNYEAIVKK